MIKQRLCAKQSLVLFLTIELLLVKGMTFTKSENIKTEVAIASVYSIPFNYVFLVAMIALFLSCYSCFNVYTFILTPQL